MAWTAKHSLYICLDRMKHCLVGIALALLIAAGSALLTTSSPSAATAEPGRATILVRDLGLLAIDILKTKNLSANERERRFRSLVDRDFDLAYIGKFVLGRHWRRASAEQRSAYQRVFEDYMVRIYSSRLSAYSGETWNVVAERNTGANDVLVSARIDRQSSPSVQTIWRVRATGEGYRVIDVMIEGVSMAITQRAEFSSFIQRNGFDELVRSMRAKVGAAAIR